MPAYRLTKEMALGGDSITRLKIKFVHQRGLAAAQQGDHKLYVNPPYDRGHMVPADDAIDSGAQRKTFIVTNIVPQTSKLNQGLWRFLEASVHQLAEDENQVYIVTGPIFVAGTPPMRGIAVPAFTFKAIFVPSRNIVIGYIASNTATPTCEIVAVAEITRQTGFDPFPTLPMSMKSTRPNFTLPQGQGVALPDCR